MKEIRIASIGGGSRLWARSLMSDLALEDQIGGEVILYDIDIEAAQNNQKIGQKMMMLPDAKGKWSFSVAATLEEALHEVDFIFISILPATFEEMKHYVHDTEKWGVYQTVGDTTGPAGIFRSLIMMPIYEHIAKAIKIHAKDAWVINFTNPMTMCVQMLYHVYPKIKAFGNCHEVFHVQDILKRALEEETGIKATRKEIEINPLGINHFTWINKASYKDIDLIPIYDKFVSKYAISGLSGEQWVEYYPFGSGERVKFDLYQKFKVIAAAGDRHLVEFLPQHWYLKDLKTIKTWQVHLTPVAHRINIKQNGNDQALKIISNEASLHITPSGEEGIAQVKAILGFTELITNVNLPNVGQIPNLPLGHVVETNALFRFNHVAPICAGPMPDVIDTLTLTHIKNHQLLLKAFDEKDLSYAKLALYQDPLVNHLSHQEIDAMFDEISSHLNQFLGHYEKR